jgi:hypothetical protein
MTDRTCRRCSQPFGLDDERERKRAERLAREGKPYYTPSSCAECRVEEQLRRFGDDYERSVCVDCGAVCAVHVSIGVHKRRCGDCLHGRRRESR